MTTVFLSCYAVIIFAVFVLAAECVSLRETVRRVEQKSVLWESEARKLRERLKS